MNRAARKIQLTLVEEVSQLITQTTGVQLGPKHAAMVSTKLQRRLRELGYRTEEDYSRYLHENLATELPVLVTLITIHHTFFFREFFHFRYLETAALPTVIARLRREGRSEIRIWSAACSGGQEVYSLSMCLRRHLSAHAPDFTYRIHGTDVDSESIARARNGVYRWNDIKEVPVSYLDSHWAKGTGEISEFVKAKASIKSSVTFDEVNLLDPEPQLGGKTFDIIFCRNVFIYFSLPQIQSVIRKMLPHLADHGFFFVGISESLSGLGLPLTSQGQSVYVKRDLPVLVSRRPDAPIRPAAGRIRVLCVDDSPAVLTILKRVLGVEEGFEVVATASDGLEAAGLLRKFPVDVVTLDIHMAGQGGIEYLESVQGKVHPPVVMISSVARESAALALRALELGARDYVEKPTLADLQERGEEIRMKVRCAVEAPDVSRGVMALQRSFGTEGGGDSVAGALRVLVAGLSDLEKLKAYLGGSGTQDPPTLLLIHGAGGALAGVRTALSGVAPGAVHDFHAGLEPKKGEVYFGDFRRDFSDVLYSFSTRTVSMAVFGGLTAGMAARLANWKSAQILIEESPRNLELVQAKRAFSGFQVIPSSGFRYFSEVHLRVKPRPEGGESG